MKFLSSTSGKSGINKETSDQQTSSPQNDHRSGEPSEGKEVLLLSSGLLALVLGIGGILMYTEEESPHTSASSQTAKVEPAKTVSSPVPPSPFSESPPSDRPTFQEFPQEEPGSAEEPLTSASTSILPPESIVVHFPFAQATLTEEAKAVLNTQVSHLPTEWEGTLRIQGHTDVRGSQSFNQALGGKRAEAVKSYLMSLGIPKDRLETDSLGKDAPICQEDTPACHDRNRRVQVEWLVSPTAQGPVPHADEPVISMNFPASQASAAQHPPAGPHRTAVDDPAAVEQMDQNSPVLTDQTFEMVIPDPIMPPEDQPSITGTATGE